MLIYSTDRRRGKQTATPIRPSLPVESLVYQEVPATIVHGLLYFRQASHHKPYIASFPKEIKVSTERSAIALSA